MISRANWYPPSPTVFYFSSRWGERLGTRLGNSHLWRCWRCLVGWFLQEPAELPSSLQPSHLLLGDATSAQSRSPGLLQLQTHIQRYIYCFQEKIKISQACCYLYGYERCCRAMNEWYSYLHMYIWHLCTDNNTQMHHKAKEDKHLRTSSQQESDKYC